VNVQRRIDEKGDASIFVAAERVGDGCDDALIRAIRESEFTLGRDQGATGNFLWTVTAEFKL